MRSAWLALVVLACGSAPKIAKPPERQASGSLARTQAAPSSSATPCALDFVPYEPRPAISIEVRLPGVPKLEKKPIKIGAAYSVWGASYFFRSRVHKDEVVQKPIVIEGYIVKTNLLDAPRCAVHRAGKADPENCRPALPAFWIGDTPGADPNASIRVMGWASNYANIFDAIRDFDAGKTEYMDVFWGVSIPNPLPAVGAKVRVSGAYGATFAMASSGAEADPHMGLLTYREMLYLEPAPVLATLPGVSRAAPR